MTVKETVLKEINDFCLKHNLTLLLVVETGSRAWGFESKDSDYDVKFIYMRQKDEYLRLDKSKDTVDLIHTDSLDIGGWDISKFLKLMYKSNPTVYEWLHCKVYYENVLFYEVRKIAPMYYNNFKTAWHYYGMSENHDRRYIRNRTPTKKRYLHAVRATLCGLWALNNPEIFPPTDFEELKNILLDKDLIPIVEGIVVDKKCGIADLPCENIPELDEWLEKNNSVIFTTLKNSKIKSTNNWNALNSLFVFLLYSYLK